MSRPFGPYEITRELGRGAMGVVYLATQRSLQRECALKTISLKLKDPRAAERFIHEGQAVAKLGKHPNIVQVFDAGIVENTPYIAMEYVEGETLDAFLVRRGGLEEPELIELGRNIALALDHAHRRGIVHRDVKPANIIIDREGHPQLLDFGIAKDLQGAGSAVRSSRPSGPESSRLGSPRNEDDEATLGSDASRSEATLIVADGGIAAAAPQVHEGIQGTPAFMAPEQADPRRGPVDARSDVYALGATLYVLATGRRPFEAATITELLVRVVREQPVPPRSYVEISPDLEAVILKAMEKDPAARYQTALEFADDLSRVAMGLPTRARKLGTAGWVWRRVQAHRRLVGIGVACLVMAGVLSAYFLFRSREIQVLWEDIAERTARGTAQEVRSLLDPALPMLEECVSLAESGLLPVDNLELLGEHLVARFRYRKKLSWLSYGDAQGRFVGAWRNKEGRIIVQRSWLDEKGGHVREQFADGAHERLRWNDEWTYDPRTRPFYQLASGSERPVWTKPYEWFAGEGLGITSAFALREKDSKKVKGVFTADYHLGALADFLAHLKIGKQGRAYLLSQSGDLLASPERGAVTADGLLTAAIENSDTRIAGGVKGLPVDEPRSFSFQHGGVAYVAAVQGFQPAAGLPVLTVVLVPEDDILGPVKDVAWRTTKAVGGLALLAVLISVVVSVWQKRRLVRAMSQRRKELGQAAGTASTEKTTIAPAEVLDQVETRK